MELADIPVRTSETVSRVIESDTFVVDVGQSQLHDMNEVGGRIWELVDGKRSVAGIVDVLVDEHEVDRSRAALETRAFLDKLRERGLIG
jgi:hypothetical protein